MDMVFVHQSVVVPALRRVQSTHDGIKIPDPATSVLCYFKDDLTNSGCIVIDVSFTQIAVVGHREQYGSTGDGLFHRVEQLQIFISIGFSIKCRVLPSLVPMEMITQSGSRAASCRVKSPQRK